MEKKIRDLLDLTEKDYEIMNEWCNDTSSYFIEYLSLNCPKELGEFYKVFEVPNVDPDLYMRTHFFNKYPEIAQVYYDFVTSNGYHITDELFMCMSDISYSKKRNETIEKWKKIPFIEDIVVNESGIYTIKSIYGDYCFIPVKDYYKDDVATIESLHEQFYNNYNDICAYNNGFNPYGPGNLRYECHFASKIFVKQHKDFKAVTALCPHIVDSTKWFHSFVCDDAKNLVIDIAQGLIMPKSLYYDLLEPSVLYEVRGRDLDLALKEVQNNRDIIDLDEFEGSPLLGLALYNYAKSNLDFGDSLNKKKIDI